MTPLEELVKAAERMEAEGKSAEEIAAQANQMMAEMNQKTLISLRIQDMVKEALK